MDASRELFQPVRIGGHLLRNRLVIAPVATGFDAQEEGEALCDFYEKRTADRGAGTVIVDGISPHFTGKRASADHLLTHAHAAALRTLTDRLHAADTKAVLQLRHFGASADHPLALSASRLYNPQTLRTAHRTPALLLGSVVKSYGRTAYRAVHEGGFDGVEIFGGQLSLPNLFFSPQTNRRHDAWGGSHRSRLALEIVECVRSYLGPTPVLSYRIPLMDLTPEGAAWHELVTFLHALVGAGVNHLAFDFGVGAASVPVDGPMTPANTWTPFMERIADEMKIPVSFGKNLGTHEDIAALLERHPNALVELVEPLIADPDWSRKIANQSPEDIMHCVRCPSGCRTRGSDGPGTGPVFCPVNPIDFSPHKSGKSAPKDSQPVLVVGSGPAGLMCAWAAARRGFRVTLCEARPTLGGGLVVASSIDGLESLGRLARLYETRVRNAGVDVRLSTTVDAAWIRENAPEHRVIVATGMRAAVPDLPGLDSPNVLTYEDLLVERQPVGRRVAVVGDTPLGRLIAQYLITPTDDRERTPEEWLCAWGIGDPSRNRGGMLGFIPHLPEPFRTVYLLGERSIGEQRSLEPERFSRTTLQWLKMNGIQTVADINIEAIDPLQIRATYGKEHVSPDFFRVDHIVLAAGFEPRRELCEELDREGIPYVEAGSIASPREALNLAWAFQQGLELAFAL